MPRVKLFNEEEVLNKAMDLFWKKGYHATSVQELVSHLGINRGSLYDTFGDKEKLFKKAFAHYRKTNIDGVTNFFKTESSVKTGFKKLLKKAIAESVNDQDRKGCFVVNTTTELIPGDEEILSLLEENRKNFETLFYQLLKEGEKDGQFAKGKDLKAIASLFFTLYTGLKVVGKVRPNKTDLMKSVNVGLTLLD